MPRGRPKTIDEQVLLDQVTELLWREGVSGISLNELARRVGVAKPALARAFGSKDDLVIRALEHYYSVVGIEAEDAIARARDLASLAKNYLASFARNYTAGERPHGCLVATATSESAAAGDSVKAKVSELNQRSLDALTEKARQLGHPDPRGLATFLFGQSLAMSALSRTGACEEDLMVFARMTAAML